MKKFAATQISHLYSVLLIAGVLFNLGMAPATSIGRPIDSSQEVGSLAGLVGSDYSHTLTTAPRAHSEVPASKQKRLRRPALDLTALPPQSFQLPFWLGQRALENNQPLFHCSFSVRPQGRAPPVSV